MFTRKRSDTSIGAIERTHHVNLHARSDALLGNLLTDRGFDSLSQLLNAYHGRLTSHARRRRLFLSFDADDLAQVQGFRLMAKNPNLDLDFYDSSLRAAVNSENGSYIKKVIRGKIAASSVVACLIGNATAWSEWVDWEIETGAGFGKGLCGVRLKGSRGRAPPALTTRRSPVARWDMKEITSVIECAAARRS